MWMCLRSWLEVGAIKCLPTMDLEKITQQLIGRRRKSAGMGSTGLPMFRLEPKTEFRSRLGASPDHVDALALCVHAARIRSGERASISKRKPSMRQPPRHDGTDNVAFIDFST